MSKSFENECHQLKDAGVMCEKECGQPRGAKNDSQTIVSKKTLVLQLQGIGFYPTLLILEVDSSPGLADRSPAR